ncbi:hypothetical protein PS673_02056 [Pseudomonas fluorescens]|uniref:DUF4113 domain-containing protein n=1 Tax=Pseudomonas fluorescens TaxID=294 RepID=A0A5E6S6C7_PSEFL|nr:hypothetical protein PS673_02056 [Pseudomonas fluorescens]
MVNLCQKGEYTEDLFSVSQPEATEKVMGVLDAINGRWGRATMRLASVPTDPDWGMRREMMSQSYTSRDLPALEELLKVAPVRHRFRIEALRLNVEVLLVAVDEY